MAQISKKKVPNHDPEQHPPKEKGSDFAPFLEDLSQSQKLSEIKEPAQPHRVLKYSLLFIHRVS